MNLCTGCLCNLFGRWGFCKTSEVWGSLGAVSTCKLRDIVVHYSTAEYFVTFVVKEQNSKQNDNVVHDSNDLPAGQTCKLNDIVVHDSNDLPAGQTFKLNDIVVHDSNVRPFGQHYLCKPRLMLRTTTKVALSVRTTTNIDLSLTMYCCLPLLAASQRLTGLQRLSTTNRCFLQQTFPIAAFGSVPKFESFKVSSKDESFPRLS